MTDELTNPAFWTERSDYQKHAHGFTMYYGEQAWKLADVPRGARVLDIAAGAGALTIAAAAAGASVLATDFSSGMVKAIEELELPGVDARVMDGQALDLPDASFDAAFSMFGIMLFADWRKGLSEMARVLRPGGIGCIGTWKEKHGAAGNLLLASAVEWRFPTMEQPAPVRGMTELHHPDRLRAAFNEAGIVEPVLHEVTSDFIVERAMLLAPDELFQFSPVWPLLDREQKDRIVFDLLDVAERSGGEIRVSSPAWIAIGRRSD